MLVVIFEFFVSYGTMFFAFFLYTSTKNNVNTYLSYAQWQLVAKSLGRAAYNVYNYIINPDQIICKTLLGKNLD